MPGAVEIVGDLDLSEAPVPGMSEVQTLGVKNTGTTDLLTVYVSVEGEGADKVLLSTKVSKWDESKSFVSFDKIPPKGNEKFYIRSSYGPDDVEDKQSYELVVRAMSMG